MDLKFNAYPRFVFLEEAETLRIEFNGRKLDAYSLGIVQLNLQDIVDKVSTYLLEGYQVIKERPGRHNSYRRRIYSSYLNQRIVRAEVNSIESSSLFEDIVFYIPIVLSDSFVRGVLQGLASNIIFAIGTSGIRGIQRSGVGNLRFPRMPDVGENMRDIVLALSENGGGELTFKSSTPEGTAQEVTIRVNGGESN